MTVGAQGYAGIWAGPGGGAELPYLYAAGCVASQLSTSQLQISVGEVRDDTDVDDIVVTGTLTVAITSTGANGRNVDTAEQANKWYAVCVIKNPTTGAVAGFLINEDDLGGFTFPAGYTLKRRIGWWRNNNSSNFRFGRYLDIGHHRQFIYDVDRNSELQALNNASAIVFTNVDLSEWVPPTENHVYLMSELDPLGTSFCGFRPGGSTIVNTVKFHEESTAPSSQMFDMETNDSQIIQYIVGSVSDDEDLFVVGFFDKI